LSLKSPSCSIAENEAVLHEPFFMGIEYNQAELADGIHNYSDFMT
jgi:hypothetical protein